jgi:hypothetical protein
MDASRPSEVTVSAVVTALLSDSNGPGGSHQLFRISVEGRGLEVDHNVSIAPRVPLNVGSQLTIHGQFEPDPGHPVIHFTHHSTGGHEGGWIDAGGRRYE